MNKQEKKQGLLAGALTGTAGIFITKAIGLIYVIPYSAMCGSATVFYSYGYSIYEYMVTICLAGIPFAIATLVAEYASKDDYKTVLMVKKMARTVMAIFGLICFGILVVFAGPFAKSVVPSSLQSDYYLQTTKTVLYIISLALIDVPILSYFKGYYQGLKQFKVYSFSQVFEQLIRVIFLLGASAICLYVFHLPQKYAVYMGVLSTSLSALGCIIYFVFFDRNYVLPVSDKQPTISKKDLLIKLLTYAAPYLVSAVISNGSNMMILLMFSSAMEKHGVNGELITIYQDMINYRAYKLTSIPQMFATGFSLAIIPHITEAVTLEKKDEINNLIGRAIDGCLYFIIPLITFMILFSKEIYFVMYGYHELEIGTSILQKDLFIYAFLILSIVCSSIITALRKRKEYIIGELIRIVTVFILFRILIIAFGVDGYFICKVIEYMVIISYIMVLLNKYFGFKVRNTLIKVVKLFISCIPMIAIGLVLMKLNVPDLILSKGKIITVIYGCTMGALTCSIYGLISALFKIPQWIFEIDFNLKGIKQLLRHLRG